MRFHRSNRTRWVWDREFGIAGGLLRGGAFLFFAAASAVVGLAVLGIVTFAMLLGQGPLAELLDALIQALAPGVRMAMAALAVAVGALSLALLIRLFKPSRSATRHVLIADELGFVLVDSRGVEAVASAAALRAPGVVDVEVYARGAGSSPVRLAAVVGVHPGASIEEAGRAVRGLAKNAVENLIGLRVSDVIVDVQVLSADELSRALS
ncbi:hypothetical protein ACFL5O_04470 [Myxococcota bacterium]